MSTTATLILVAAIVIVAIIVVGIVLAVKASRRRLDASHRAEAARLRDTARDAQLDAQQHEVDAAQAEAAAKQAEIDAQRLRADATQRQTAAQEAHSEATRRSERAARIDPDVGTRPQGARPGDADATHPADGAEDIGQTDERVRAARDDSPSKDGDSSDPR